MNKTIFFSGSLKHRIHNIQALYLDLLPAVGKPWVEVDGNEQGAQF